MTESCKLDQFDRALLAEVRIDNLTSARVLAERVGLSESAIIRRLKRLRQAGVIIADRAIVDPAVLGETLLVHILVSLERETSAHLDAFSQKVRRYPEVKAAWYVTGETDFILIVRVESMSAYDAFVRRAFHEDENVKSFRSNISIRDVVAPHI